jgi:hypothetical protein
MLLNGSKWHIHHGDCIPHMAEMPERSIDFSVFFTPIPLPLRVYVRVMRHRKQRGIEVRGQVASVLLLQSTGSHREAWPGDSGACRTDPEDEAERRSRAP